MSDKRVAAVVLAAGNSSRLGRPKQLLEIGSKTLLRRTVETTLASQVDLVVVSIAKDAIGIAETLHNLNSKIVEVENPELGQSESIRAGLEVAAQHDFDAALFIPCDLPLLSSDHLNALVAKYQQEEWQIVASRYCEILGAPMLIDRALWPELRNLRGDTGARKLLSRYADTTSFVDWSEGQFDLDTLQDVEKLRRDYPDMKFE